MADVPPPFVPPPSGYQPPRRKSNAALIITIILICVLVPCIAVVGFGVWIYQGPYKRGIEPFMGCAIGFKDLGHALKAYEKDHDGKLPSAETWQDDMRSYYIRASESSKEERGPFPSLDPNKPFECVPAANGGGATGIAFNTEVSGKKVSDIKDKSTVVLFETDQSSKNAHGVYKDRGETAPKFMGAPREWFRLDVSGHFLGRMKNSRRDSDFDFNDSEDSSSSDTSDSTSSPSTKPKGKAGVSPKSESPSSSADHESSDRNPDGG